MTEEKHRKFDVIIGNPPFQDESIGNNSKAPPFITCLWNLPIKLVMLLN